MAGEKIQGEGGREEEDRAGERQEAHCSEEYLCIVSLGMNPVSIQIGY